jgi:hypothetical protein
MGTGNALQKREIPASRKPEARCGNAADELFSNSCQDLFLVCVLIRRQLLSQEKKQ